MLILAVAFAAGAGIFNGGGSARYQTAVVARGTLTQTVAATGELKPSSSIEVSSELSGRVRDVFVDFNDEVVRGAVLATLDPSTSESQVRRFEAEVAASDAQIVQQNAVLAQEEAGLRLQEANFDRTVALSRSGFAATATVERAEAELSRARAAVQASRANLRASQARAEQTRASLQEARLNLARTRIVAPASGIVINRQIEPGQTVAASLSAPTLFVIASDPSRLEAVLLVDEADISEVRPGQQVRLSSAAFPDQEFAGVVRQVRMQAEREQGVVSFTVVAEIHHSPRQLRPGMSVSGDIVIAEIRDVLNVPAAALRFTPSSAPADQGTKTPGVIRRSGRAPTNPEALRAFLESQLSGRQVSNFGHVWLLRNDEPVRVSVEIGATDGRAVEVRPLDTLRTGERVIVGERGSAGS